MQFNWLEVLDVAVERPSSMLSSWALPKPTRMEYLLSNHMDYSHSYSDLKLGGLFIFLANHNILSGRRGLERGRFSRSGSTLGQWVQGVDDENPALD